MQEQDVRKLIEDQFKKRLKDSQFGVGPIPVHAHTGVDSAQIDSRDLYYFRVPRTVTQSATPTINTDNTSVAHITGLAQAITSFTTNLIGTPQEGDLFRMNITDDGTARAITWGAKFESSGNVALPTTTVISTRLDIGFFWNSVSGAWRCVALA